MTALLRFRWYFDEAGIRFHQWIWRPGVIALTTSQAHFLFNLDGKFICIEPDMEVTWNDC